MQDKLFALPSVLEERPSDADLVEFSSEAMRIGKYLDGLVKIREFAVVALTGPFGAGKSSALAQIHSERDWTWLKFDVWKYPDRKQIWDGFVIQLISKLDEIDEGKTPLEVADLIDGRVDGKTAAKAKREFMGYALLFVFAFCMASLIFGWGFVRNVSESPMLYLFGLSIKYALPVAISLLFIYVLFTKYEEIIRSSHAVRPLGRLFELQERLSRKLDGFGQKAEGSRKVVIIEVEDVDRAGKNSEGQIFIETLKNFVDNYNFNNGLRMIVIVPQRYSSFIDEEALDANKSQRMMKAYTHVMHYSSEISKSNISKFFDSAGTADIYKEFFINATGELLLKYKEDVSFRTLKFILRQVDEFYSLTQSGGKDLPSDPRVLYLLLLSRYLHISLSYGNGKGMRSVLHALIHLPLNSWDFSTFCGILLKIHRTDLNIDDRYSILFKDLGGDSIRLERSWPDREENIICLNERYLKVI